MESKSIYNRIIKKLVRTLLGLGSFEFWQKWGWHVLPNNFYSNVPDTRKLAPSLWDKEIDFNGIIDLKDTQQLETLKCISNFQDEYDLFPENPTGNPLDFYTSNRAFNCVDAQVLYGLVRFLKPQRIMEIGTGNSSLLINHALAATKSKDPKYDCEYYAIEPFPEYILGDRLSLSDIPNISQIIKSEVQEVPLDVFSRLEAGDVLFIDSTHTLKIGGDVKYEILEILPNLKKGVWIHIHDIFIPYEYPKVWALQQKWFWLEQYLVQAFLSYNKIFEVRWLSQYMHRNYSDNLKQVMKGYDPNESFMGSLWLEKVY